MSGPSKRAFSLLEIIVAMAIIGIMATIAVPRISRRGVTEIDQFVRQFNILLQAGYINGMVTNKLQRVFFNFENERFIELQIATDEKEANGEFRFESVKLAYATTRLLIPEWVEIKNFFLKDKDVISSLGSVTQTAWLFIMPGGLAQPIIMNIYDTTTQKEYGLVLNPFTVQLTRFNEYQKPA